MNHPTATDLVIAAVQQRRIDELLAANSAYTARIQEQANRIRDLEARLLAGDVGREAQIRELQATLAEVRFELNKTRCENQAQRHRIADLERAGAGRGFTRSAAPSPEALKEMLHVWEQGVVFVR